MRSLLPRLLALGFAAIVIASTPSPSPAQVPALLTRWGHPGTGDGAFTRPAGIAVSPAGDVYVTDWDVARVQRFRHDGTFVSGWGFPADLEGDYHFAFGIAVGQGGDVFVVDDGSHLVLRFTADGNYLGVVTPNLLPEGIAADASGYLYVHSQSDGRVHKLTVDGQEVRSWGSLGTAAPITAFMGIAVGPDGNVYVADQTTRTIQRFTPDGVLMASWAIQLVQAAGLAVDAAGNVYLADSQLGVIRAYAPSGQFRGQWLPLGRGVDPNAWPLGLAVDADDHLFVAGSLSCDVLVYDVGTWPTSASPSTWGALKALYR